MSIPTPIFTAVIAKFIAPKATFVPNALASTPVKALLTAVNPEANTPDDWRASLNEVPIPFITFQDFPR